MTLSHYLSNLGIQTHDLCDTSPLINNIEQEDTLV